MSWFLLLVIRSLGHCRRGQVPAGGAVNLSRGLLAVRFAILDSMSLRKEFFSFLDQTTPVVEVKRSRL
jgi:hypothetical protein